MEHDIDSRFGRMALLAGDGMMRRMARMRVILFGLGGVGSWCAEALVRAGVAHITVVDRDEVALSNCNRQLPALDSTMGLPKAEVLRRRLLDINPQCDVRAICAAYTPENATDYDLAAYDWVVDAIDSLRCKAHLLLASTAAGTRTASSMGAALKVHAADIAVAEFRQVQGCPLARALRNAFKRAGRWPSAPVACVYSPEHRANRIAPPEGHVNGTLSHTTAIFGMRLAGIILEDVYDGTE